MMEILQQDWFWLSWAVIGAILMRLTQIRILGTWPSFESYTITFACMGVMGGPICGIFMLGLTFFKGSYVYVKPNKSKKGWSKYF